MAKGGCCHLCLDATIPGGMTCAAGPDGCGYCRGACGQPVAAGAQEWVVDEHGEVTWPGLEVWGHIPERVAGHTMTAPDTRR